MTKGIHRVTADSKRGRQLASRVYKSTAAPPSDEVVEWNRRVDEAKAAKKLRKGSRNERQEASLPIPTTQVCAT